MGYRSIIVQLFLIIGGMLVGQENSDRVKLTEDTIFTKVIDCNILFTLNNRKIDYIGKKSYIYTEPYYKRAYNSKREYAVFQIGKRKGSTPFLYTKIFTFNTCIKKDEVLEFITNIGYRYRMKNSYEPNCEGNLISKIRKRDLKALTEGNILSIKILTFEKDYEFHLQEEEADRMKRELQCLQYNHFKFK